MAGPGSTVNYGCVNDPAVNSSIKKRDGDLDITNLWLSNG